MITADSQISRLSKIGELKTAKYSTVKPGSEKTSNKGL